MPVCWCGGVPPGQRTIRQVTTAVAKGMSTAAMTLRKRAETGAAGPWECAWECPWAWGEWFERVTRASSQAPLAAPTG
ncbi:hypothetical protein GCM10010218_25090 [Streptomyces mashuensis]|uniref:Uncharacterized protein n=1 Tax=Streptomyces mashuensis TaxID=33904 RepID=A0A919EBK8_9ACTN|nr:hypothetical protein GCM10010218_25090 [Streptomyces mashuensis]